MENVEYKNPWYNSAMSNQYSNPYFIYNPATGDGVTEYKGYTIYQRWDRFGFTWDVVKDAVCITQRAGINGAKKSIDKLLEV